MNQIDSNLSVWTPWMRRALQLAALAEGCTSPNPLVGAVVLNSYGNLVGEGFHQKAGTPHAEVHALSQAGSQAKGGTLLVTLEPCCHQGLTPPCTEFILKSGISRVVVAIEDPDPRVSGLGISKLKEEGLEVINGLLSEVAEYQNRAFFHRVRFGRPWGILKWAMSLDGRLGLANGASKWISCPKARNWVYHLRAKCDSVIVGAGTIRSDNPLLTSRGLSKPEPLRVVLTNSLDLPFDAQVWNTKEANTLIAFGPNSPSHDLAKFPEGVEKLALKASEPIDLLNALSQKKCNQVLWECGPSLATAAIKQNCIQEIAIVLAPKLLGGKAAMTPLADLGFNSMQEVLVMENSVVERLGSDLLLTMLLPTKKE